MGGNQTAIFQQGQPLTNYDVIQKVPDHNISYLKHKTTNKQYMIRQFAINDKTQFSQTCEKIKNRKKMQSQFITRLQRFSQQMEDNLCSAFYKIYAMWQYPTHTLADQINQRALQKRRFLQNQIFSIIASVIQGMSCLQASGVKHECLNGNSILFDETGTVKVADPMTSISQSNFDLISTNRKAKGIYISPQQCQSLKNQRPIPNRNPYKSDVFVLGLILLECGLLEKIDTIFVQNFEDIDHDQLNKKMNQFGKIYSKDLKLTIQTMLTRDPKQRMDWIGLKQYVPQKNDDNVNKSNVTGITPFKYQTLPYQSSSQSANPITNKLILGGGKIQSGLNTYSREPLFNPISRYQPQSQHNYDSVFNQTSSTFNQTFGQPIQSFSYQQGQSTFPSTNLPSTITGNFQNTSMNSNIYGNQKVSNYIIQNKPSFERPTEQFFISTNPSKINSGLHLIDRDSSSFPLNSQFQFKKDYLGGGLNNFNPSYGVEYQPLKQFSTANQHPISTHQYPTSSNTYTTYSNIGYALPSTIQPQATDQAKSVYRNDRTQINTQGSNSPFLSNYVKDAKSITYDKNLYNSYITEQKSHNNHQQMMQQNIPPPPHYSTMVTTSNNQLSNGGSNNYYQPINKPGNINNSTQISSNYVVTSNPVLYKPLSTSSGIKQKPNLSQPFSGNNNSQIQKQQHNRNKSGPQMHFQPTTTYQYQQINHTHHQNQASHTPINPPSSSGSQQLEYVIEHFKQGSRYQGTKYQDMRHGQGKFFYQDGGMYEGNWKFNKMDGFGKLYYQSGKIAYEGNWSQDQFQGFGKLYNQEPDQMQQLFDYQNFDNIDEYWMYYEGNFVGDQKDGQGKMVFANGQYFVGNFQKDMVDGPGQFHRNNGQVIKGVWSQNQLVQVEQ